MTDLINKKRAELISERVKLARERIEKINDLIDDVETQEDITLVQQAYDGFIYTAWRIEHDGGVIPQDIKKAVGKFNQTFTEINKENKVNNVLKIRNIGDITERPAFFDKKVSNKPEEKSYFKQAKNIAQKLFSKSVDVLTAKDKEIRATSNIPSKLKTSNHRTR